MRDIIFRGKRVDNDKWVEGYYVCLNEEKHFIYSGYAETDCGGYYPDYCEVIPETVGQYTGLTDKNGTKIFEGDIANYEDDVADFEGYHDDVFINSGEVIISPWGGVIFTNRKTVEMDDLFDSEICVDAVVCGNIYDNHLIAKYALMLLYAVISTITI